LLLIKQKRVYCGYRVAEFPCDWDGRAFRMVKAGEGSDPESDSYDVFCSRSQVHQCSCKGFAYGRGKPCKHIAAGLALIANGWL
jgi:SWIM zinc finger